MKNLFIYAIILFASLANANAQDLDSKYAKGLLAPGTVAPNFTLKTADNKDIELKTYRGDYVVLDFWASWCSDCRKAIPLTKELWNDFRDYNVRFIGVSFDTNKDAWIKTYWDKYQMNWTQVSELKKWKKATTIDRLYKVDWIPTLYLIDPNGKIILGTVQIDKLRAKLEQLRPMLKLSNVDVQANYIGGDSIMNNYLMAHQLYTILLRHMKIQAKVIVMFNIEMDGTVTGARVLKMSDLKANNPKFYKLSSEKQQVILEKAEKHFRNEAVRLVSKMPKWKPALNNGRPIASQKTITVNFDPYWIGEKL